MPFFKKKSIAYTNAIGNKRRVVIISKYSQTIEYNLRTTLDSSGISRLQSEIAKTLVQLQGLNNKDLISEKQLSEAQSKLTTFQNILSKSYNSKLGLLDVSKFNKEMSGANLTLAELNKSFNAAGSQGVNSFNQILGTFGKIDTRMQSVSKTTDKIFNTLGNTVRWGIIASGFQSVLNSTHQAVDYMKDLDSSLTNIMMVTDYNRQAMNDYAKSANEAAKALGSTTVAMTDATLVFAQQGFDLPQSQQLATLSTKLANASQQDTATTSDQITAYMNAYGMDKDMEKLSLALDKWAEVANISAADVQELATASQKAASTANTVGVNMDQLAAQIATIESVTREAPENIGNGLKTLYARFSSLEMGETLEDGVDLKAVTKTLDKIGVEVLDSEGKMNDVGDIMENLMEVWQTLDKTQKAAVAETVAGKFQLARFESLMNRSDLYKQYKSGSETANGTLDVMNEKYINSLEGRLNKLQATTEGIMSNLFQSDDFNGLIDGLTNVLELMNDLVKSINGGGAALTAFGAIAVKVFSNQIGRGLSNFIQNRQGEALQKQNTVEKQKILSRFGAANENELNAQQRQIFGFAQKGMDNAQYMSLEQVQSFDNALQETIDATEQLDNKQKQFNDTLQATEQIYRILGNEYKLTDKDGNLTTKALAGDILSNPSEMKITQDNLDNSDIGKHVAYIDNLSTHLKELDTVSQKAFAAIKKNDNDLAGTHWNKFAEVVDSINKEFIEMAETGQILPEIAQEISDSLEELFQVVDGTITDPQKIDNILNKFMGVGEEYQNIIKNVLQGKFVDSSEGVDNLERISQSIGIDKATLEAMFNRNKGMGEQIDQQRLIGDLTSVIGSLGQLSFAWQSFQSLGSLWVNADIDLGEKISQTIMNLGMTLPMLVNSFKSMGEILKKNSILTLANQLQKASENVEVLGVKTQLSAILMERGSKGLKVLNAALESLTSGWGMAAMAAVAAAATIYKAFRDSQKASLSTGMQDYEDISKMSSASTASYEEAYKKYQRTKVVSDDLKDSSKQLADALHVVGAEALINAGNFELLNQKIKEASQNSKTLATIVAEGQLNSIGSEVSTYHPFENDFAHQLYGESELQSRTGLTQDFMGTDTSGKSIEEKIGAINNALEDSQEKIKGLRDAQNELYQNKNISSEERQKQIAELQKQIEAEEEVYRKLSALLGDEQLVNASKILSTQAQSKIDEVVTKSDTLFKGMSVEDIIGALTDENGEYQEIARYYKSLGEGAGEDFIDGLLSSLNIDPEEFARYKMSAKGLSEAVIDEVVKQFGNDKQGLLAFSGSIDESVTDDNIQDYIDNWNKEKSKDSALEFSYKGQIEDVNKSESTLDSLFSSFENNEAGGFTPTEVAKLLEEHPEYIRYLTKVGDLYKLNQEALEDYNRALKEQQDLVYDNMGEMNYLSNYDGLLSDIQKDSSHEKNFFSEEVQQQMDGFITKNQELNQQLQQGKISVSEYLTALDEGLTTSGFYDQMSQVNNVLDDTTDYLEEIASVAATEMSDALIQSTKQFLKGEKSVQDYVADLDSAIKMQQNLIDSTYDLQRNSDGLVEAVNDEDEAAKNAAESYNELAEAQEGLTNVKSFIDTLSDNADFLSSYTDEAGNLLDSIFQDSRINDYISQLTNSFIEFSQTSAENMSIAAQQISSATGASVEEVTSLLQQANSANEQEAASAAAALASMTGSSLGSIQALTQASMSNVSGAITNTSTAIGSVLTALGQAISGFDYKIEATPYISGGFGIHTDENGVPNGIDLPTFGFNIKGSGGASVQNFAAALNSAGAFFTNEGNQQAAAKALDIDSYKPSGSGQGATPTSGRPGSGSGKKSGGSGGKGKEYKGPSEKDPIEEEVDRYEKVNVQLERLAKALEKVAKAQDRVTSLKYADNLDAQTKILQKQIDKYEEKLALQRQEAAELKNSLGQQYGVTFDTETRVDVNGNKVTEYIINNYAETLKKLEAEVNSAIAKYNASGSEDEEKANQKAIDAAQKRLNDFKKDYKRYDELMSSEIAETEANIQDCIDKAHDFRLELFKTAIEGANNLKELNEAFMDFKNNLHGLNRNDPLKQAQLSVKKLGEYWDSTTISAKKYYKDLDDWAKKRQKEASTDAEKQGWQNYRNALKNAQTKQGNGTLEAGGTGYFDYGQQFLDQILAQVDQYNKTGTSDWFGSDDALLYEALEEALKYAEETLDNYVSETENLRDSIKDAVDDMNDKFERRIKEYQNIVDDLEHDLNVYKMLHGDKNYAAENEALIAQNAATTQQILELQEQIATNKAILDSTDPETQKEQWQDLNDKIADCQSQINDLVETTIERLRQAYENTVNKVLDQWTKAAFGTDDLDWIQEEWELINRNADYYLDDINKAFNIQKLQGKYLELLDNASGLHIQKKISDQMAQQLSYLREKTHLSQYDVQYAEMQLEILQKQIALEEAQRNKSQMKLKRDSQGNYKYVYTANDDDLASKEQDLLEAQNNAYNLSKDAMIQAQNDALAAQVQARQALFDIWTDANLTLEEKEKHAEEIINNLNEYLSFTAEQLGTSQQNLLNDTVGMIELLSEENAQYLEYIYQQLMDGNDDAYNQIDARFSSSLAKWLQNNTKFKTDTEAMYAALIANGQNYAENVDQFAQTIGQNFDDISSHIQTAKKSTDDLVESTGKFRQLISDMQSDITGYNKTLAEMNGKITAAEGAMQNYAQATEEAYKNLAQNAATSTQVSSGGVTTVVNKEVGGVTVKQPASGGGGGGGGGASDKNVEGIAGNIWVYGGWGNDPTRHALMRQKFGDAGGDKVYNAVQYKFNHGYGYNGGLEHDWGYYKSFYPSNFLSGGYTGTWGDSEGDQRFKNGKLAYLHQKELILNESDTLNMLKAVESVRKMTDQLKSGAFDAVVSKLNVFGSQVINPDQQGDLLEQNVHITAEFPAANSADEIKAALLSLNDTALQYVRQTR